MKTTREMLLEQQQVWVKEYNNAMDLASQWVDEANEEMQNEVLSIDTTIDKKVVLAFGWPSYGYIIKFSFEDGKQGGAISWVRWYADWWTYEEISLTDDEVDAVVNCYSLEY